MLVSRRAELGDAGLRRLLQIQARQVAEQARAEQGRRARRDLEHRENAAYQAALRPALQARLAAEPPPAVPADDLLHLVLPSGPQRQRPLSARRRERYRRHLQRSLAELLAAPLATDATDATATASPPPDPGPAAQTATAVAGPAWAGTLCGVCRGGCCTLGGNTAYLDRQTLQRFMRAHPQLGPEAVLAHYLAHLPATSMAGSCIHHTRQGCSLPGPMRSQTCNQFRCGPLALLQAPDQPVAAVVVIQRRQNLWRIDDLALDNGIIGATLLRAEGAQALRPRPPEPGRN